MSSHGRGRGRGGAMCPEEGTTANGEAIGQEAMNGVDDKIDRDINDSTSTTSSTPEGVILCICRDPVDDGFSVCCDICENWSHGRCIGVQPEEPLPGKYLCHTCDLGWWTDFVSKRNGREETVLAVREGGWDEGGAVAVAPAPQRKGQGRGKGKRAGSKTKNGREAAVAAGTTPTPSLGPAFGDKTQVPVPVSVMPAPPTGKSTMMKGSGRPQSRGRKSSSSISLHGGAVGTGERMMTETVAQVSPDHKVWYPLSSYRRSLPPAPPLTPTAKSNGFKSELDSPSGVDGPFLEYCAISRSVWAEEAEEVMRDVLARRAEGVSDLSLVHLTDLQLGQRPLVHIRRIPESMIATSSNFTVNLPLAYAASANTVNSFTSNKSFLRPVRYGMFSEKVIEKGQFITDLKGSVQTKIQYLSQSLNQYSLLGLPKPYVYFYPGLDLVADARVSGNEGRFVRTGCHPNAEIAIFSSREDAIGLGIFAKTDIMENEEIVIPWDWNPVHVVHTLVDDIDRQEAQLNPYGNGHKRPSGSSKPFWSDDEMAISSPLRLDEERRRRMTDSVSTLLGSTDCACSKRKDCVICQMQRVASGKDLLGFNKKTAKRPLLLVGLANKNHMKYLKARSDLYPPEKQTDVEMRHRMATNELEEDRTAKLVKPKVTRTPLKSDAKHLPKTGSVKKKKRLRIATDDSELSIDVKPEATSPTQNLALSAREQKKMDEQVALMQRMEERSAAKIRKRSNTTESLVGFMTMTSPTRSPTRFSKSPPKDLPVDKGPGKQTNLADMTTRTDLADTTLAEGPHESADDSETEALSDVDRVTRPAVSSTTASPGAVSVSQRGTDVERDLLLSFSFPDPTKVESARPDAVVEDGPPDVLVPDSQLQDSNVSTSGLAMNGEWSVTDGLTVNGEKPVADDPLPLHAPETEQAPVLGRPTPVVKLSFSDYRKRKAENMGRTATTESPSSTFSTGGTSPQRVAAAGYFPPLPSPSQVELASAETLNIGRSSVVNAPAGTPQPELQATPLSEIGLASEDAKSFQAPNRANPYEDVGEQLHQMSTPRYPDVT